MRKATALVSSDSDSKVRTVRPPWVSASPPRAGSVMSTAMPRRRASSTMIRV